MRLFKKNTSDARALTAVSFAADAVCAARVRRDAGQPPVLEHCALTPVQGAGGWADALAGLKRSRALGKGPCAMVIEPAAYQLLQVESPEVPPDELRAAVRWRIRELIDFHLDDAVVDVFDLPPQKGNTRQRLMYVVAARVPRVREKTELMQAAGLDLQVVDIPELAQRNLATELPQDAAGVALLNLQPGSGLITLTRQGTLYLARRLEAGLEQLPADAADAEDAPVRAWLDGLMVEIQRSLDFYEASFALAPIAHLAIAPLPRPVSGLAGYVQQMMGLEVTELSLDSVIDCRDEAEAAVQARCFNVVGAALRNEARSL